MKNTVFGSIVSVYRWLDELPMFGKVGASAANFSLDRIRDFCEVLGDPQDRIKTIHVAGTNGKGTVCRMVASVCQSAGYKTGLYTSPHLTHVRERFRINSEWIPDDKLLEFFQTYETRILSDSLTYFEICTAIAFWHFHSEKVDVAVIETGLGGRLDATNIIKQPLVCAITSIGLDHTDILGNTLSKIASEKGGIIKKNVPVVVGNLPDEAFDVISLISKKKCSDLYESEKLNPKYRDQVIYLKNNGDMLELNAQNRTKIDALNCSIVYQILRAVGSELKISDSEFKNGIENLSGRFLHHAHFQRLHPENPWYFDGSHNPESISVLMDQLREIAPITKWTLVLSMMRDKSNSETSALWNEFEKIEFAEQNLPRAETYKEFRLKVQKSKPFPSGQKEIINWLEKRKSELVIFGGSFYFYDIVRRWTGAISTK